MNRFRLQVVAHIVQRVTQRQFANRCARQCKQNNQTSAVTVPLLYKPAPASALRINRMLERHTSTTFWMHADAWEDSCVNLFLGIWIYWRNQFNPFSVFLRIHCIYRQIYHCDSHCPEGSASTVFGRKQMLQGRGTEYGAGLSGRRGEGRE